MNYIYVKYLTICLDAVELLLKLGSDVNAQIIFNRNTALTLACIEGRDTIVSLLLDNQANIEHCAKVYIYT